MMYYKYTKRNQILVMLCGNGARAILLAALTYDMIVRTSVALVPFIDKRKAATLVTRYGMLKKYALYNIQNLKIYTNTDRRFLTATKLR